MEKLKFPTTLKEFREQFSEEAACFEYLGQSRWPVGFVCPRCAGSKYWVKLGGMFTNAPPVASKLPLPPERSFIAHTFRSASGFGRLTWSPHIPLA